MFDQNCDQTAREDAVYEETEEAKKSPQLGDVEVKLTRRCSRKERFLGGHLKAVI